MLNWPAVRAHALRYAGLTLALWGLPFGFAAAKIALTRPPGEQWSLPFALLGLLPAGGMLLLGLAGVGLVAYSAGWLHPRR